MKKINKKTEKVESKFPYPMRLNKYLAMQNYTTRRGADDLIEKGLVTVNGKRAVVGQKIEISDKVVVKENKKKDKLVYYAYNKPIGIVTTGAQEGEEDILMTTKFPHSTNSGQAEKVFPIGRLDKDSHGLIIMTNDGRLTDKLLSPDKDHEKEYVVRVDSDYNDAFLDKLSRGVKFDDYTTKPAKTKFINEKTFSITLTEGKKRQIRKMVSIFRHFVTDLKRIRIMNITLGKLKDGEYREIKGEELEKLLKSLGM
jgi:23S rRNA pseudouridine2604 synthase